MATKKCLRERIVRIFLHMGKKMTKEEAEHLLSCRKCSSKLGALYVGTLIAEAMCPAKKKG